MKQFLLRTTGFLAVFLLVSAVLVVVDLYVYDYNANPILNDKQKLENKVVIIGSSKVRYGVIKDSLLKKYDAEVYAEGGQYNLESLNFLLNKHRRGEIGKGNTFFINLEAGDPLATSFRKFNWFAENFFLYQIYPWGAFTPEQYPKIVSRIYVDILALGMNRTRSFTWDELGIKGEKSESKPDLQQYRMYCDRTARKLEHNVMFDENMPHTLKLLSQLEQETGSKIYMLVPPGSHMLDNAGILRKYFPADRVIDLTCIDGLEQEDSWFDGNHLNGKGAHIFTEKLIEVVSHNRSN